MSSLCRLVWVGVLVAVCGACGKKDDARGAHNPNNEGVLRRHLEINLAEVGSLVAMAGPEGGGQALRAALTGLTSQTDAQSVDTGDGPHLLALMLSGEVLEVTLLEPGPGMPDDVEVRQPRVVGIFPTASWVIFSTPNFTTNAAGENGPENLVLCSLIAARRVDGALFCAPISANLGWKSHIIEDTIFANAAGDVVHLWGMLNTGRGVVDPDSAGIYRLLLGASAGPTAAPALSFPVAGMHSFFGNATGDLYVNYFATALGGTARAQVLPLDGSSPFTLSGSDNGQVAGGDFGGSDADTFYVAVGGHGGVSFNGTFRIVTKTGSAFAETSQTASYPGIDSYFGLARLSDGVYTYSDPQKSLLKVIADGAVLASPVLVPLLGVNRIAGMQGDQGIRPVGGRWVFIADTGAGYKFVRHDGVTQQDIPFDATIDVWSFTVSTSGAIEFFGYRAGTNEKLRGSVAAGSTEVSVASAGVVDPADVVAFTQIN